MGVSDLIAGYFTPPASGWPQQPAASTDPGNTVSPPGMSVLGWRDLPLASPPAGADGLCTVTFLPVDPGQMWLIDRMTVSCTSTAATVAFVYAGPDIRPSNLRDFSDAGNLDVADNASPLQIAGTRALVVQWADASPGAVGVASIQFRILG